LNGFEARWYEQHLQLAVVEAEDNTIHRQRRARILN
jgi:hypothetical protein